MANSRHFLKMRFHSFGLGSHFRTLEKTQEVACNKIYKANFDGNQRPAFYSLSSFVNSSLLIPKKIISGLWSFEGASRNFSSSCKLFKSVTVNFVNRDGTKETVEATIGDTLLDVVIDNDLDIDGYGACEGTLACSTCHLVLEKPIFDSLPEPTDEELDMLDLAFGLTDLSRLGCQVELTQEMDGATFTVPEGVADARDV